MSERLQAVERRLTEVRRRLDRLRSGDLVSEADVEAAHLSAAAQRERVALLLDAGWPISGPGLARAEPPPAPVVAQPPTARPDWPTVVSVLLAPRAGAEERSASEWRVWATVHRRWAERPWCSWLQLVCDAAAGLAGVRGAAVSVLRADGSLERLAATDRWTARVDDDGQTAADGPALEVCGLGQPVACPDLASEPDRWPVFASAVAGTGLRGVWCVPLVGHDVLLGVLTFYGVLGRPISERCWTDARAMAALAVAGLRADLGAIADGTFRSPFDGSVVHQAQGAVVAGLGVDVQEAATRLRAHAFGNGTGLSEVAAAVLAGRLTLD